MSSLLASSIATPNLQSLVCVLLLQLLEPRHLDFAGLAPGRPEVQKDGFAAEIREANSLAVKRFQSKVGRHCPLTLNDDDAADVRWELRNRTTSTAVTVMAVNRTTTD